MTTALPPAPPTPLIGLLALISRLSVCERQEEVAKLTVEATRELIGADGVTFVLRDGDLCWYLDESAIGELWKGRRFPLEACISGWVMTQNTPAIIEDVFADPRIPADAYRPTFVRSLVMAPVGRPASFAAIGAYWRDDAASPEALSVMQHIADAAALALRNVQLIEDRRRAEAGLAALVEECAAAARAGHLGAVEQLTAGVTHHFNNFLTVVAGCLDELEELPGPATETARRLAEAARRGEALIARMADFARARPGERLALDVRAAAVGIAARTRSRLTPMVVEIEPGPAVWALIEAAAYETALTQLIVNASEAGAGAVKVGFPAPEQGNWVVIEVADDGPGLPTAVRERALLPFFTTRPGAAGLGLAVVDGLVRRAGGRIETPPTPSGARFRILLPTAARRPLDVE